MLRQGARAAFVTWSLEKPTQGLKIKNYLSETRAHFLNICYLSTTLQALKVQTHELLGDTNNMQTTERSHAEIKNLHSISCPMSRSPVPAGCWQQGGSKEAVDALMILSHLTPVGWAPGTWEIAQAERCNPKCLSIWAGEEGRHENSPHPALETGGLKTVAGATRGSCSVHPE